MSYRWPLVIAALVAALGLAGCGGDPDIRTVADFDDHPCALFSDDAMMKVVSPPYMDLAGVAPKPAGTTPSATGNDTYACTYAYTPSKSTDVREISSMNVTLAHTVSGSQPLAICAAGATAKAGGYKMEPIGDQACLSPSSDLWMRLGSEFFHVVVVPQPGFASPVETNQALSPLILEVAKAIAARMPKS